MKVEDLITGIIKALGDEFADIPVYTERQEQDFQTPCFFVRSFRNKNEQMINGRFNHMVDIEVLYFPTEIHEAGGEAGHREEMNNVSDRLMYALAIIAVGDKKLPTFDRESTVSDDTLVFTFNTSITERFVKNIDKMQTNELKIEIMETEHTHFKDKHG